jgi:hypothetical protein
MNSSQFSNYGLSFNSSDKSSTSTIVEEELLSAEEYSGKLLSSMLDSCSGDDMEKVFEPSDSYLYKINKDNTFTLISSSRDVYEILDKKISIINSYGIAVHTTGWAAPLDENGDVSGPPSQSPFKRRVALICCATDISLGSAMVFGDNPSEIVTDPGTATGTLADAISSFWHQNKVI